jgi:hypothetical protein
MTLRLTRMTLAAFLLAGIAGCNIPGGGGGGNACAGTADDEPTTLAVGADTTFVGCIDSPTDTDTITFTENDPGNGTVTFTVHCSAASGVALFDNEASTDFVPCDGLFGYGPGNVHSSTNTVKAAPSAAGGETYTLHVVWGLDNPT